MLRFQIALAIILVGCVAFLSCGRGQDMLTDPVADDMMGSDDTSMDTPMDMMMDMMEDLAHRSWASVMLPAPTMTVDEAKAAMNPGETGQAHGLGPRTVYFNEVGAMANRAGIVSPAEYPVGTIIVKEVMDATDTSVITGVVTMMKTDDPMYDAHNGWIYGIPKPLSVADSAGCHGCHTEASTPVATDSVFVSLGKEVTTMDDTTMDDTTMDDTTMDDTMMDDTTMDDNGADNGNGANGNGNGNGANGNGNGNGAAQ